MDTDQILKERQTTHGDFPDVAEVNIALERAAYSGVNWDKLPPVAKIAIKMILHKIARVVSGNWSFDDHWADIMGYAGLVRKYIAGGFNAKR